MLQAEIDAAYFAGALKAVQSKRVSNGIRPKVTVAATQFAISWDIEANLNKAEELVRNAVKKGAQVVLLQELFECPYFCQLQRQDFFNLASTANVQENAFLARFQLLAKELKVVLPISFFEKEGQAHYNSIIVFDADGSNLGVYRKSHIPDGIGYQEKFYFNPGDTGFKVFCTAYANIGIGICWDQWFPECARCLALSGAELILYPTAIGTEPQDESLDSRHHWRRVMCGHAGANLVPVIASNRIGREKDMTFYGTSFIANHVGEVVCDADDHSEAVLVHTFDLEYIKDYRSSWGVFRDRRPELYSKILTLDGVDKTASPVKVVSRNNSKVLATDLKGFRMPGEFEHHRECWMAFPVRTDNWRDDAFPAQQTFVEIVKAIAEFEPVSVLVDPQHYDQAKQRFGVLSDCRIRFIEMQYNDIWLRDIGPTFVVNDELKSVAGIDWEFNSWGGRMGGCYEDWSLDNMVAEKILSLERANLFDANFVMEGGSIHVDGQGTLITTEECLLNPNRNPHLTKSDIEAKLKQYLGVSVIIWLPLGVYGDDDTNGHVDNIACFSKPGEVILAWTDDVNDPQYERSNLALQVLNSSVDARGRKLTVHKLHMPSPMYISDKEVTSLKPYLGHRVSRVPETRMAATYVNFYIANGGIVVPGFNDPVYDARAVSDLQKIFPHHRVVQVQARNIILGGGNIHCITQQQPQI